MNVNKSLMRAGIFLLIAVCCSSTNVVAAQERTSSIPMAAADQNNGQFRDSQGRPWVVQKILAFIRDRRGYITHDQLEKALGIKLVASSDGWGGYVSKFEGDKNGQLSLQLNEYSGDMPMPAWMIAQGEMEKAHSELNIAFVGACYALSKAKSDLEEVGLHETGEIGLLGTVVGQFNEEEGRTKVKIYYISGIENASPCVYSMRLDAYRYRG